MKNAVLSILSALLIIIAVLFPLQSANATWITILNEQFINPWGSWPWPYWQVPNTSNGYRWGIVPNISHWPFEPLQSIWCCGLYGSMISDLDPFVDAYPAGMNTRAIWGPFSLANNIVAAECNFWFYNDTQQTNDYLLWGAATSPTGTIYEGGRHSGPNPSAQWANTSFSFDSLKNAQGTYVSFIGQSTVYLIFLFYSDGSIQTTDGGFLDDISLGYDDGLFDLIALSANFYTVSDTDTTVAPYLYEGIEYLLGLEWFCEGTGESPLFNLQARIDNIPWITSRQTATGGTSYMTWADSLFGGEIGDHTLNFVLDVNNEVVETHENNNSLNIPFAVEMVDSIPFIQILRPTFGDSCDDGFWIKWDAYDRESNARIYLYSDTDSLGYNGPIINGNFAIYEDTSPDSFYWDTSTLPNGAEYYVFARIDDYYNAYGTDYSDAPLTIKRAGVKWGNNGSPEQFRLFPNSPNPFNCSTTISYYLPEASIVELTIYDISGRKIASLIDNKTISAGSHSLFWSPEISSGVYFCKITAVSSTGNSYAQSQKMLLLK